MRRKVLLTILLLGSFTIMEAITPEQALKNLVEGNERYVQEMLKHPKRTHYDRKNLIDGQAPFATILSCSDSRVATEIIFDQGLGDLFVVRVAGNVLGKLQEESIDFAVKYLKSSLILVLGHQNCGAIAAVKAGTTKDIKEIAKKVKKGVKDCKGKNLDDMIKCNVNYVVNKLKENPLIKDTISTGKLKVLGGYYHLKSGKVELLD